MLRPGTVFRDKRVYGHTTTAMPDMSTPCPRTRPSPPLTYFLYYLAIPYSILSYRTLLSIVSCPFLPLPYHAPTLFYPTLFYPTLPTTPIPTLPYPAPTQPFSTLPYPTYYFYPYPYLTLPLFYPTLPYPTIPIPTLPYPTPYLHYPTPLPYTV